MSGKQIEIYVDEVVLDGLSGYSADRIRAEIEQAIRKKVSSMQESRLQKRSLQQSQPITVDLPSGLEPDHIAARIAESLYPVLGG